MSYYDHDKFTHPVPAGFIIPKGTQVYSRESAPHPVETFFTMQYDYLVHVSDGAKFYLDYDITKPKLPTRINSVIYNVRVDAVVYQVAVYQGNQIWSAFSKHGGRTTIYTPNIESFDTTPPAEGTES